MKGSMFGKILWEIENIFSYVFSLTVEHLNISLLKYQYMNSLSYCYYKGNGLFTAQDVFNEKIYFYVINSFYLSLFIA